MTLDPRVERGMAAQLFARRRLLDAGEEHLGWKVGFGTPPVMEKLGTSSALVGYLMRGAIVESGSSVSLAGWTKAILEPEIAVHMGADVTDPGSVADAVAGVGAAIELADLHPPPEDVEAMLAGDLYQRGVLLGPMRPGFDVSDVRAVVVRNGEEAGATDDPTEATGDPLDVVAHVAATLSAAGEQLRGGSVIICGSVIPALEVQPGDTVEVALEPLGTLRVSFT
jgi:2-keto-4-pentenoate hydratase